jgi:hypothetical protein
MHMKPIQWITYGLLLMTLLGACNKGAHHYGKKARPLSRPADGGMMGR